MGAAWRGDRAAECGGLENRCAPGAPGVRIPPSPLKYRNTNLNSPTCYESGEFGCVIVVDAPGDRLVQPDDSPAREPVPHRSGAAVNISVMTSMSMPREMRSSRGLSVMTMP